MRRALISMVLPPVRSCSTCSIQVDNVATRLATWKFTLFGSNFPWGDCIRLRLSRRVKTRLRFGQRLSGGFFAFRLRSQSPANATTTTPSARKANARVCFGARLADLLVSRVNKKLQFEEQEILYEPKLPTAFSAKMTSLQEYTSYGGRGCP